MPVNMVYVEGKLDQVLLVAFLAGAPPVEARGTKGDLPHLVRRARAEGLEVCYLRDRDFDYLPELTSAPTRPVVDRAVGGVVHGYRWQRHCIESYLLEPGLVKWATGICQAELEAELLRAAGTLRFYEAGRWCLGQVRTGIVPPSRAFRTQPLGVQGMQLPDDLTKSASFQWVETRVRECRDALGTCFQELPARYDGFVASLRVSAPGDALLWYSGKDLLAAMAEFLASKGFSQPADFVNRVASRVQGDPGALGRFLPEWVALRDLIRS